MSDECADTAGRVPTYSAILRPSNTFPIMKLAHLLQTSDSAATEDFLREAGFPDATRARKLIESLAPPDERESLFRVLDALIADIADSADAPRALLNFSRLCDATDRSALFDKLNAESDLRERLIRLLAFSQSLADWIVREPQLLDDIATARPRSRAELRAETKELLQKDSPLDELRRFRHRETLRIALLDLERATWRDENSFDLVVCQISDLAQVCVQGALGILAPENLPFAVIAMGKLGARELNYSSDIDLIFLGDGDSAMQTKLGTDLLKILSDVSPQGTLYRVDMKLRPDGKSGALVTPFGYALNYYESYAAPWEWQALIKARALAGDARLARRFRKFTRAITWARRGDDAHLRDMLAMKKRMESTRDGGDDENVKTGPGAIRDCEWIVQQLQMMVGPSHAPARAASTLRALQVMENFDALSPEEERRVREGYLFLRVLEHRLQLLDERAVRTLPKSADERAALARRMGCTSRGAVAVRWLEEEHSHHRKQVRAVAERLFWGWNDEESTPEFGRTFSPDAHTQLERIASGTSTQPLPAPLARQIRLALAPLAEHLEAAADPNRAVANLERLCDASGNRLSLLRSLDESPQLARAVSQILGGSQWLSDTLARFPELLDMAARRTQFSRSKPLEEAQADCRDYCFSFRDTAAALRGWKSREMLRIGLRDLALQAQPLDVAGEIANLAQSCLGFACEEIARRRRPFSDNIAFAVLGMGKLGGGEMHYASDADVIFVYDDFAPADLDKRAAASREAIGWAEDFMKLLGEQTPDGICFEVDARLRPDGKSAPLARTVAGFVEYFERTTNGIAIWERQSLTRARFIAGDRATAARLQAAIRHVAFPDEWNPDWGDELRHIKGRVESERGAKVSAKNGVLFDVKLGRGALSDIEFCAQWLAMKNGARFPDLQTPNMLRQIEAARAAALLSDEEAIHLRDAYVFLRRAELRLQIVHGRSSKALASKSPEFASWARAVFPDESDAATHFESVWKAHTEAARRVMERVRDEL